MIIHAALTALRTSWRMLVALLVIFVSSLQGQEVRSNKPNVGAVEQLQAGAAVLPVQIGAPNPAGTNTSYKLLVNDLIKVEVYNEKDLERVTRVDQDGTISLPLIQTVQIAGKTVAEARALLRGLYEKDYLVSADVDVTVVASSQTNKVAEVKPKLFKFTVSGQVKKPGIVEIAEGEKVTLVEAILQAGDFTNIANKNKVSIMRLEKGVQKVFVEDVEAMLINPKSKRFEILPGDVISVKQTIF